MKLPLKSGWVRLCASTAVFAAIALAVFGPGHMHFREFLVWTEYLSASPGLSGAMLLVAVMVGFVGACYLANWVAAGFKGKA